MRASIFRASAAALFAAAALAGGELRLSHPEGLCFDREGRLHVADTGHHRVQILSADGAPPKVVGGPKPGADDGQFRTPTKVTVDENGHIIVSDAWSLFDAALKE